MLRAAKSSVPLTKEILWVLDGAPPETTKISVHPNLKGAIRVTEPLALCRSFAFSRQNFKERRHPTRSNR